MSSNNVFKSVVDKLKFVVSTYWDKKENKYLTNGTAKYQILYFYVCCDLYVALIRLTNSDDDGEMHTNHTNTSHTQNLR